MKKKATTSKADLLVSFLENEKPPLGGFFMGGISAIKATLMPINISHSQPVKHSKPNNLTLGISC